MSLIYAPVRNLPNGTRINGIEHIYQTTKPTTRANGSALVIGDIWHDYSMNERWMWNGVLWVSDLMIKTFESTASTPSALFWRFNFGEDIYLDSANSSLWSSTATSVNYWSLSFFYTESNTTPTPTTTLPGSALTNQNQPNIILKQTRSFNFLLPSSTFFVSVQLDRVGAPSNAVCGGSIKYRRVKL